MTAKISTKKPAVLNIFIKNAGKSSVFDGKFLVDNKSDLKINAAAQHLSENTGILMNFRVIAHPNSYTKLHGVAEILQNCTNCKSDIGFSALAAPDAKIEFFPAQKINAIPDYATHSASIWRNTPAQIEYLKESGLGESAIKEVLEEAYKNW